MEGYVLSDFFETHSGLAKPFTRARLPWLWLRDKVANARLRFGAGIRAVRHTDAQREAARILVVGIVVPSRPNEIEAVIGDLCQGSRHAITVSIVSMEDKGKFANIDHAIERAPEPLAYYDWLVIIDDDVAFEVGRLDDIIAVAAHADLALSQPAHAYASYTTYDITRRRPGVIARQTDFVEIGPLTLLRADLFDELIPFPASRWCYGIDLIWSDKARAQDRKIGIIDGAPIRHLRPVAAAYDLQAAFVEGQTLLEMHGITISRDEILSKNIILLHA